MALGRIAIAEAHYWYGACHHGGQWTDGYRRLCRAGKVLAKLGHPAPEHGHHLSPEAWDMYLELAYGDERVEYEICDDCVIWVHNGEEPFDGTSEAARNRQATAAIFSTARGVAEDRREWSTRPCECCGTALHGDRTLYVVSGA